jgi:putative ABC transport system permease protein
MLDIALKNISARKMRSVLCIIGVMICVFLIGIIEGLSNRMEEDIAGDIDNLNNKMYFQQKGAPYPPFGSSLNESVGDQILARNDIDPDESTCILFSVIEPPANPREAAKVFGVGLEPGKEGAYLGDAQISNGEITLEGEGENAVILGSAAAEFYDASISDDLVIRKGTSFKVVGILKQTDIANTDNAVLMPLSFAQKFFGRGNMISAVLLTPGDNYLPNEIEEDIESDYPNFEVRTQNEIEEELDASLEMPRTILGMINTIVFIVTIVIIMNVMMMSVKEKTKEIGTMRAIGTKRSIVILIIFYETLILSVLGGVFGILLIVPGSFVVGISWSVAISVGVLTRVMALIFLMGAFSGLLPAYLATRVSPLEALRYE